MLWIDLIAALAICQYLYFVYRTGKARGLYGIKAPATGGHEMFERHYRVQMNTLELLIAFLPALYIAAHYWWPTVCAAIGAIFVIGRLLYERAYVRDPASRAVGYGLSALSLVTLLLAVVLGILRTLFLSGQVQ